MHIASHFMLIASNFQAHAARLVDRSISDAERRRLAAEVRDAIEVVHSQDYGTFLEHFLPAFVQILTSITKPQFVDNDIHRTRAVILEVMHRLPHNDVLKSGCHKLLPLAMTVMQTDNEENSVTAIHIVFDLHKTFRPHLEDQVEPFLHFVRQLYSKLNVTVDTVLRQPSPNLPKILPASQSFKVITECPLVVMFVFQLYPRCRKSNTNALLPLMLKAIQIEVGQNNKNVLARPSHKEFIAAQVKTVTFLVYLLKQDPTLMNFDETRIPQSVVQLLKACPGNAFNIRRELLVATRHMLSSPFRKGFFSRIDALLDERVIAGTSRASTEVLRPIGYQFLAELIHGVRFDLQLHQLNRIISMFSTNLHDPSLTLALQTNACRLLLNLVEGIIRRNDSKNSEARSLLVRIMTTMVAKYRTIGDQVPRLLKSAKEAQDHPKLQKLDTPLSLLPVGDPLKEINECKTLLKTLTLGLKTVVWTVINIKVIPRPLPVLKRENDSAAATPPAAAPREPEMALREEETELLTQLLPASQKCFKLYKIIDRKGTKSSSADARKVPLQAEQEIYDQFAQIFTILNVRSFQDIFGLRMQELLEYIVENPSALVIAQHFLTNPNICKYFADILLNFVSERITTLGVPRPKPNSERTLEQKRANVLLSLFKSVFGSLPSCFEPVLRLHVGTIVRQCITHMTKCEDPYIFLQLLRCLFKNLTSGNKHDVQFDSLFRDFMPLVEPVLSGLLALYNGPHRLAHKDLIIELCLLIPARPATLFPYLRLQMKPIVWALKGSKENVQFGLRALDFWLEILQPHYFEKLLDSVEPDLNRALQSHLRLHYANPFGTAALRIMGRLGARSRNNATDNDISTHKQSSEKAAQYQMVWSGVENPMFELSMDEMVLRACKVVLNEIPDGKSSSAPTKRRIAWDFCRSCLAPFFGLQDEDNIVFAEANLFEDGNLTVVNNSISSDYSAENYALQLPVSEEARRAEGMTHRTRERTAAEINSVRSLLVALISAAALSDFQPRSARNEQPKPKESPKRFAVGLSRYFAILLGIQGAKKKAAAPLSVDDEAEGFSSPTTLEPSIFLDAVVEVMSRERPDHREAGVLCLKHFVDSLLRNSGLMVPDLKNVAGIDSDTNMSNERRTSMDTKEEHVNKADMAVNQTSWVVPTALISLVASLCHSCYQRNWHSKVAGAIGLGAIIERVPSKVFKEVTTGAYEARVVRALMFVVRDLSSDVSYMTTKYAKSALEKLLVLCHGSKSGSVPQTEEKVLKDVTVCLTYELTSDSTCARAVAKDSLRMLAKSLKCPLSDVMAPVKEQILQPLRQRSIRQLSFPVQIGFIDAVTFCLQLEKQFISADLFSQPLTNYFLMGVVQIPDDPMFEKLTEAEDGLRHKLVENKLIHTDVVDHLAMLRRCAVELLSNISIRCAEHLREPTNDEIFCRMISIFFKCLQSRDKDLVATAKTGLKQAISQHQKPKETLQRNLRPVLSNLADYKKLTLPYLQSLSRILELLSHWFNVNLGDKLLEHLQHWTEPHKIVALKRGAPGTESQIGAAILDLFHLLPPAASKFIDALVYMVLRLEFELGVAGPGVAHLGLKGEMVASTSPFREPLLKFCNKHPDSAIKFFLSHLGELQIRHLFFVLLRADRGSPLRVRLASDCGTIIRSTFDVAKRTPTQASYSYYGVVVFNEILKDTGTDCLRKKPEILTCILQQWNSEDRMYKLNVNQGQPVNPEQIEEQRIMAEILIQYCKVNLPATEVLFDLLKVFRLRVECDFSFVKEFISHTVSETFDVTMKVTVLEYFLDMFSNPNCSQERKVHALQLIVIPMLKNHLQKQSKKWHAEQQNKGRPSEPKGSERKVGQKSEPGGPSPISSKSNDENELPLEFSDVVLKPITLKRIVKDLLDKPDEVLREYDEPLSAELLQLSTLLIELMPKHITQFRKELIKFGWAHLKREDSVAKHWAFVNVSRFFEAYEAPPKIILQVYVALLRAVHGDGKALVREALDILTPALPQRLKHNPNDKKCPIWIRYTKKVLLEEGHSVTNLVHIWQLVIRHAGLFHVARSQFVPIMVNSLSRIGMQGPNVIAEYRRVALDLADLIISWKKGTEEDDGPSQDDEGRSPKLKHARTQSLGHQVSNASKANVGQSSAVSPGVQQSTSQAADPDSTDDFRPNLGMLEVTINFLTQIPFRPMERRERDLIAKKCISLIDAAMQLCPVISLKLLNLERLLEATEKSQQQVARGKPSSASTASASGTPVVDPKSLAQVKSGAIRIDKLEAQRIERSMARRSALHAALEMCIVLSRRQSALFVRKNASTLIALIGPSLSERNPSAARYFAKLFVNILKAFPDLKSRFPKQPQTPQPKQSKATKQSQAALQQQRAQQLQSSQKHQQTQQLQNQQQLTAKTAVLPVNFAQAGSNVTHNTSKTQVPASGARQTSTVEDQAVALFYSTTLEAIERCLRSDDCAMNYCGLVVLQNLLAERPEEFARFRDLLIKLFSRVVKDNMQPNVAGSGQQNASSSKLSLGTSIQRNSGASDSKGNQNSGSTASISEGIDGLSKHLDVDNMDGSIEGATKNVCLSLLATNIVNLETNQRKSFIQGICFLIERCVTVEVLLEIVRIVGIWATWKQKQQQANESNSQRRSGSQKDSQKDKGDQAGESGGTSKSSTQKEPLQLKDKVNLLTKMIIFERISGPGSQQLMNSYLEIILTIFGSKGCTERRPELLPKLERAFLVGLNSKDPVMRAKFFDLFDQSLTKTPLCRLYYILSRQDWSPLVETCWIKHAVHLLAAVIIPESQLVLVPSSARFPRLVYSSREHFEAEQLKDFTRAAAAESTLVTDFLKSIYSVDSGTLTSTLRHLSFVDDEMACRAWVSLMPRAWSNASDSERTSLESGFSSLLIKEYHIAQSSMQPNCIQALVEGASKCDLQPVVAPELLFHLGARWNAWHIVLPYLQKRYEWLSSNKSTLPPKTALKYEDEKQAIMDVSAQIYRMLNEVDCFSVLWKKRGINTWTSEALSLEQRGRVDEAQELYAQCMRQYQGTFAGGTYQLNSMVKIDPNSIQKREVMLWQERWILCAKNLCQWDVLTEYSRSVVESALLHECLWRVPDWSALKELLYRHPIEDGPTLRLYQAYIHLQDNKLETADSSITMGFKKSLERFCSLPQGSGPNCISQVLCQFQQLVELEESSRILGELNALSRHGNSNINVEQKIDNVKNILAVWRERLPAPHEQLYVWNNILTWRNHVHAVVVRVLETLKEAANAKVAAAQTIGGPNAANSRVVGAPLPSSSTAQVQAAYAISQSLPQQVLVIGVNETAWNIHRFARACRKQGQPNVAINALLKLYPFGTMELSEYFVKTMEAAKSFYAGPTGLNNNLEYGLNELNRCNMDHFSARQKAQLFTMKGRFYSKLGMDEQVAEAYSVALSISGDVGSGWLSWGQHCDELQKNSTRSRNQGGASSRPYPPSAWREAAVNCYLQAVRFGSRKARNFIPRAMRLLTIESSGTPHAKLNEPQVSAEQSKKDQQSQAQQNRENAVQATFSSFVDILPAWVWLPWVSQLVTMLSRPEAPTARAILVRVVQPYPQAIFFPLRSFMEERKQIDKPRKLHTQEALKTSRSNTSAFLPGAANAHAGTSGRQVQAYKDHLQKCQLRLQQLMEKRKRIEETVARTNRNAPEFDRLGKEYSKVKEDIERMRKTVQHLNESLRQRKQMHAQAQATAQVQAQVQTQTQSKAQGQEHVKVAGQPLTPSSSNVAPTLQVTPRASSILAPSTASGNGTTGQPTPSSASLDHLRGKSSEGANQQNISDDSIDPLQSLASSPFEHADIVMARLVKAHQGVYGEIDRIMKDLTTRMKPQQEEQMLGLMNALLYRCYHFKEVTPSLRTALSDVSRMCFNTVPKGTKLKGNESKTQASIADLKSAFEAELAPQVCEDFPTDIETFIRRLRRWKNIFQRRVDSMESVLKIENVSRHLTEIHNTDVEVFGQYLIAEAVETRTDSHAKISRFGADVVVVRRHVGAARGITVLANDGKEHYFMFETSANAAAQPVEERTAQLFRLFNASFFSRHAEAQRRRTQIEVPKLIPTGQHTRLISYDPSCCTLADGLESFMEEKGRSLDDPLILYRDLVSSNSEALDARRHAYRKICKDLIPISSFSNWISSCMQSHNHLFAFKTKFAETLGSNSLANFVLAVGSRRPQSMAFSWKSGAVVNLNARPSISARGLIESEEAVPFRLTRNIKYMLGDLGLDGALFGSMAVTMEALGSNTPLLRVYLECILHDEIAQWLSTRRSNAVVSGGEDRGITEKNYMENLRKRLTVSVDKILARLEPATTLGPSAKDMYEVCKVTHAVHALIESAAKEENLVRMDASWQPWF